ncbi:MAG TPA: hypothetical protein EYP86_02095 [Candidatus Altiarchaeales archaeon]|nr:hypothetical protein [Candidatus Altiarchaeales archaeon]
MELGLIMSSHLRVSALIEIGDTGKEIGQVTISTTTTIEQEKGGDVLIQTVFIVGVVLIIGMGILVWDRFKE